MVQSDSLGTLHLQLFHHKVSPGCVHSCNLPPTSGSARLHSLFNYTPGQKFIEFFFNELSHRDNGKYQQFVNSGMVTYQFQHIKLRNIVCVGVLATVQCP